MPSPPGSPSPRGPLDNPFLPENVGDLTAAERRAYALRLHGVRERLRGFALRSEDGVALRAVIEEVDAALAMLLACDGEESA